MKKKMGLPQVKGLILPGDRVNAHLSWSKKSDGPMNLIGREYPPTTAIAGVDFADPFNPSVVAMPYIFGPQGDAERLSNRGQFLSRIGLRAESTVVPKLMHGAVVQYVTHHNEFIEQLQCDGLVTDIRGLALTVGFADCPSVVLFDGETGVLALLHAGWKPIAAGIIEEAIRQMQWVCGAHPSRMQAFIGPGVGKCCYEVGPEVATAVDGLPHQGHLHIDLADIITMRLVVKGVDIKKIRVEESCTACMTVDTRTGKKPLYYSYRREKRNDPLDTGVFVAVMR